MKFELDEILADSILFSMEDQNNDFLVDTQEEVVVSCNEIEEQDDQRYIHLPEWDSNDGFRLMERFASSFKNPPVKKALTQALDQGRGVFRAFKDVLNQHPEVEQLWYKYKEQEMRRHILKWYNALREEWGIEKIGEEPEETGDLILEDFRIRQPLDRDKTIALKLHELCIEECCKAASGDFPQELSRERLAEWNFPEDISWVAENSGGDFTAYILAKKEGKSARIIALEVMPEYRGLGIGEALLNHFIAHIDKTKMAHILIDLPVNSEGFSRVLFREAFAPYETRYYFEIKHKEES